MEIYMSTLIKNTKSWESQKFGQTIYLKLFQTTTKVVSRIYELKDNYELELFNFYVIILQLIHDYLLKWYKYVTAPT